ncbi:hypothetical protein AB0L06_28090 [Spirillospora sp. NPDC052269]
MLLELGVLVLMLVLDQDFHFRLPWLWVAALLVILLAAVHTWWRARRGFTLTDVGMIWHKHQISVPWSNVTAVDMADGRIIVRVAELGQLRDGRAFAGITDSFWNLRRFGGPIVLRTRCLSVPAEDFVAQAERLREAFDRGNLRQRPSSRAALLSTSLNIGGVVLAVVAMMVFDLPLEKGMVAQRIGTLEFQYRPEGPDSAFAAQTLTVANWERLAVAPTLALTPQDEKGREVRGVTVRTAFGADRGLLVVPPRGNTTEILAFDGPNSGAVRRVKVAVRGSSYADGPGFRVGPAHAKPVDRSGAPLELGREFDRVFVTSPAAEVRVMCIVWEPRRGGRGQQMAAAYDFGHTRSNGVGAKTLAVPAALREHSPECGTLAAVFTTPERP